MDKKKKVYKKLQKKRKFPEEKKFPNKGENDKKWFNNIKGLLDSITLPQFLVRKGIPNLAGNAEIAVPSVAAIQVLPTLGSNENAAIDTSMRKLYANLRRANTGSTTYSVQDLKHYIYNLSIAIIVDRYIRRAYGLINNFDGLDAAKPMAYFKAMGLDYDSFKDNMADLRLFINNNSIRLHSVIAGKCDLFERRSWMFDHVFTDGTTNKSQDILFTIPESLSYYDWGQQTYVNVTIPLYTGGVVGRTYSNVIASVTAFMNALTADVKVSLISADLIKAFGVEQSKDYFTCIDESYKVAPVYNEEVLNEIQNAKLCGNVNHNISDDANGNLVEDPYITTTGTFGLTDYGYVDYITKNIINYYNDKIDILDYAVATRLSPKLQYTLLDGNTHVIAFGSEIPMYIRFVLTTNNGGFATVVGNGLDANGMTLVDYNPFEVRNLGNINKKDLISALWSYFDWLPLVTTLAFGYYDNAGTLQYETSMDIPMLDFDNYAVLDTVSQVSNIHTACVQSLLYWPDVIKDQRVLTLPDLN